MCFPSMSRPCPEGTDYFTFFSQPVTSRVLHRGNPPKVELRDELLFELWLPAAFVGRLEQPCHVRAMEATEGHRQSLWRGGRYWQLWTARMWFWCFYCVSLVLFHCVDSNMCFYFFKLRLSCLSDASTEGSKLLTYANFLSPAINERNCV